ncbi:MAG: HmuY family protein [Bacteroidales bacterium]|jgi:hypothetical protein|nr:HmuY family protein [Bacteroidales bacterium]
MKKWNLFLGLAVLAIAAFTTVGCKPDAEDEPEQKEAVTLTVDASGYENWVYVSFEQKKIVNVSDHANDLSWDIAFHRMDVRLNGGVSGKGKAAGLETEYTNLSDVATFPTSGYTPDVMDSINVSMQVKEAQSKNLKLSSWVSMAGMPPKYTISEHVYIVQTAAEKHVKIKFIDYLNAENKGGHVKFTYVYMD